MNIFSLNILSKCFESIIIRQAKWHYYTLYLIKRWLTRFFVLKERMIVLLSAKWRGRAETARADGARGNPSPNRARRDVSKTTVVPRQLFPPKHNSQNDQQFMKLPDAGMQSESSSSASISGDSSISSLHLKSQTPSPSSSSSSSSSYLFPSCVWLLLCYGGEGEAERGRVLLGARWRRRRRARRSRGERHRREQQRRRRKRGRTWRLRPERFACGLRLSSVAAELQVTFAYGFTENDFHVPNSWPTVTLWYRVPEFSLLVWFLSGVFLVKEVLSMNPGFGLFRLSAAMPDLIERLVCWVCES